jgi:hypothetical protein
MLLQKIWFWKLDAHKANAEVGEENDQFTKLKFSSCLKVQIRSSQIHIFLEWKIPLWLLWKVIYEVKIAVLAIQNCLSKGPGLHAGEVTDQAVAP